MLAAVTMAGCDGGPELPDGFVETEWNGARFAHPADWEVAREDAAGLAAYGDEGAGGVVESAYLGVDERFAGDFRLGVDEIDREAEEVFPDVFRNRERLRDDAVDVRGAREGRLLEYAYDAEADGGGTVRVRKVDVFAHAHDGTLVYLSVSAAEENLDAERVDAIVESLRVDR